MKISVVIIIAFLLSSCDKWGTLSYKANADTDAPITIKYHHIGGSDTTTVTIPVGSTHVLQIDEELIAKKFPENDFSEFDIQVVSVKKGNTFSSNDFNQKSEWFYIRNDDDNAEYLLYLDNDDF